MARKNKKHHSKTRSKAPLKRRTSQRWVFAGLLLTIIIVSYVIVRAAAGGDVAVSAPNGSLARDSQLQLLEQERMRDQNATYDARYKETLSLDEATVQGVIAGSYDEAL